MSYIELDSISYESTSEKSYKNFSPNCKSNNLQRLTEEGLELKEEYIKECVKNNFKIKDDVSNFNLFNSEYEKSNNTIENQNFSIEKKTELNNEPNDVSINQISNISSCNLNTLKDEQLNENKDDTFTIKESISYISNHDSSKSEGENSNKIIENLKDCLDIQQNEDINNDNTKKREDISNKSICQLSNSDNKKYNNTNENQNNLIGKKTKRNEELIDDNTKKTNQKKEKIFGIIYPGYRHDYYIKDFKRMFLKFLKNKVNEQIINIKIGKKKGKLKIHTPNKELYGGNSKEEDNKKFIDKTVKEVFIDQSINKKDNNKQNKNKEGISRQKDNEVIFNIIEEYQETLLTKMGEKEQYKKQYEEIQKLKEFLGLKIRYALDMYYNSEEFGEFRSNPKIKYYDEKFKNERNRNISLLEKKKENEPNNFVKLVEMPFYCKKPRKK